MTTRVDTLTDDQLISETHHFARAERLATAGLVRRLAEMDARRLFLREGCPSLYIWCTEVLRLSEAAAYNRIEVARIGRRFPAALDALDDGSLTLTAVKVLGPYLTAGNHAELLASARHKTKREIEGLLMGIPLPTPVRMPARETVIHLGPGLHEIRFTITADTREKLERARELLRHVVPNGEYATIFDRALTVLLEQLERRRAAAPKASRSTLKSGPVQAPRRAGQKAGGKPRLAARRRPASRHIPAAVRREVFKRDGGRCAFVGRNRRRCTERGFLEFHHVQPFAAGGRATADNISLRCRRHNQYEAEAVFGEAACRRPSRRGTGGTATRSGRDERSTGGGS